MCSALITALYRAFNATYLWPESSHLHNLPSSSISPSSLSRVSTLRSFMSPASLSLVYLPPSSLHALGFFASSLISAASLLPASLSGFLVSFISFLSSYQLPPFLCDPSTYFSLYSVSALSSSCFHSIQICPSDYYSNLIYTSMYIVYIFCW